MDIEAIGGVNRTPETTTTSTQVDMGRTDKVIQAEVKPAVSTIQTPDGQNPANEQSMPFEEKAPAKSTLDSAISTVNSRITKTRCEYSYDEATKRVSIKVFNKDSEELIREVPPEKSLEMLQKMWELAGIIVDEKR